MIASTDTWKDRSSQERFQKQPEWCRLCLNENTIESRQHLLTVCPATAQLINSFSENLGRISIEKEKEYLEFSHDKKWKWILGGGIVKQVQKVNQYRLTIPKSVFSRGENVTNRIDKKNLAACGQAYFEFKNIESRISTEALIVFTDGSVKDNKAGSGAIIYHKNKPIYTLANALLNHSISFAELDAVKTVLQTLSENLTLNGQIRYPNEKEKMPIHIFTDSMYTQNILCATTNTAKHFYMIEEIRNMAETLSTWFTFTIHWIPSHIENTDLGTLPIHGNVKADKLATSARKLHVDPEISAVDICEIRKDLLQACAILVSKINTLLTSKPALSFDGPSSDDFRNSDAIRDSSRKRKSRDT